MDKYPLVSFQIFTYNQEKFVEEAVRGALSQDYPNLEIIISDDCSSDRTFDIIKETVSNYNGPHKIILNRNETNLGLLTHYNKINHISHGEIIVMGSGDDVSLPNRTSVVVQVFLDNPNVMSLSSETEFIDENGNFLHHGYEYHLRKGGYSIMSLTEYVNFKHFYLYPGTSRVLRRDVINKFPIIVDAPDEDIYTFVRSLYIGDIAFVHEVLSYYRQVNKSITHSRFKRDKNITIKKRRALQKDACTKQFHEDLDYAIKQGYVEEQHRLAIQEKLDKAFDEYIFPVPKSIFQRGVTKGLKLLARCLGANAKK